MYKKLAVMSLIVSIFFITWLLWVSGGENKKRGDEDTKVRKAESNGEELSKYFEVKESDRNNVLLPTTMSKSEGKKCQIGDNEVFEGTVVDGATCIVQ